MPSAEYDLRYLRAGLDILEDYLLAPEIYWTVGKHPPPGEPLFPQLTLGGLLLAQTRLQGRQLSSALRAEFDRIAREFEALRNRRRVAFEQKARREFGVRLKLWTAFLSEYRDQPENHYDRYRYEVSRRVMLQLLQPEARELPQAELELLASLDNLLRAVLQPGEFIWDDELRPAFPQPTFWYLYGGLRP